MLDLLRKAPSAPHLHAQKTPFAIGLFSGTGSDRIETGRERNSLAKFLNSNISSEICFDLANGIRKTNHSATSKMHIIQSNCIDTIMYENQENLQSSKLIVHVDPVMVPENQTIHKYNNVLSTLERLNNDDINWSKKKKTIVLPLFDTANHD
jgi:hypothetical protein